MNIEVTPRMIGTLGRRIASLMRKANNITDDYAVADFRLDGILYALSILGIACDVQVNDEEDRYVSVSFPDWKFHVADGTTEQTRAAVPDYKMELISQGMFLDQPMIPGPKYTVAVFNYRLNGAASYDWFGIHPGHRAKVERWTREYLGIPQDANDWSFQPNKYATDVLTVTHIEKIPDVLPYFGKTPSLPEAKQEATDNE